MMSSYLKYFIRTIYSTSNIFEYYSYKYLKVFLIIAVLSIIVPVSVWAEETYQFTDENGVEYWADVGESDEGVDPDVGSDRENFDDCEAPDCYPMDDNANYPSSNTGDDCEAPDCYPMDDNANYPSQNKGDAKTEGGQGTGGSGYKAILELNYESDCWAKTDVKLNDGVFGKSIANETVVIDPNSDEANDLWETVTLGFDKVPNKGELQMLVNVYDKNNGFIESMYDVAEFSKSQKTYNFQFNGLVPC